MILSFVSLIIKKLKIAQLLTLRRLERPHFIGKCLCIEIDERNMARYCNSVNIFYSQNEVTASINKMFPLLTESRCLRVHSYHIGFPLFFVISLEFRNGRPGRRNGTSLMCTSAT